MALRHTEGEGLESSAGSNRPTPCIHSTLRVRVAVLRHHLVKPPSYPFRAPLAARTISGPMVERHSHESEGQQVDEVSAALLC